MNRITSATYKQMMDYSTILTNDAGDELWRFFDGDDGKPRWKVFAIEPKHRTIIKRWNEVRPGADYFDSKNDNQYVATDYILPKKYFRRVAALLNLKLVKDAPKQLTESQKVAFAEYRKKKSDEKQIQLDLKKAG